MAISEDDTAAIDAADRWCDSVGIKPSYQSMTAFAKWLGDPLDSSRDRIVDMSKPEIRRKIELINSSPHWRTLIKVMEIQRGE